MPRFNIEFNRTIREICYLTIEASSLAEAKELATVLQWDGELTADDTHVIRGWMFNNIDENGKV